MELLGERPVWSMSGSELLSTLDALEVEAARRESYRLKVVAAIESTGYAAELGARDTAELMRVRYRLDAPVARRRLRLAQALTKYPAVSAALDDTASTPAPDDADDADADADADADDAWLLRPAQAEAIVSALDRVPSHVPIADRDAAEQQLVKLAAHLSPGELRQAGDRMRDILDTDGPEPEEHKAYAREPLTLAAADRGVKFRGYLANENAELLRALIHAGARPHKTIDGEHDPRSREKRQADALTNVLGVAASAADTTAPATPPPTPPKTTTTGPDEARAATAGAGAGAAGAGAGPAGAEADASGAEAGAGAGAAGAAEAGAGAAGAAGAGARGAGAAVGAGGAGGASSADVVPGFGAKAQVTVTIDFQDLKAATANASGQLVYGDGLSAATVRRLACDARIIPLVLGANSEPLDVGRSERLVTRAMRRALNARDRGCVICGAPPIMCDAHHLQSWIDGGETKVSNLVLLCRRHHVDLHRGQWTVTIVDGTVHVARPTWAEPPPTHRRPARRRTDHTPDASPPGTTTQPAADTRTAPSHARDALTPTADTPTAPPQAHGTLTPTADTPTASGQANGTVTPASGMATASAHADGTVTPAADMAASAHADGTVTPAADLATASAHVGGAGRPAATSSGGPATRLVADDPVAPRTRQSRWKADEATLQQAAAFALASAPSG